jgi:hypothetical protein
MLTFPTIVMLTGFFGLMLNIDNVLEPRFTMNSSFLDTLDDISYAKFGTHVAANFDRVLSEKSIEASGVTVEALPAGRNSTRECQFPGYIDGIHDYHVIQWVVRHG